jgi:hypothetical protein
MIDIYLDVFYKSPTTDIDFKDALPILMLYTGKGKNFTIDWFFYEYIDVLIKQYEAAGNYFSVQEWKMDQMLQAMKLFNIDFNKSNVKSYYNWKESFGGNGFCCEDRGQRLPIILPKSICFLCCK